jgi:hypothetical protein
MCPSTKSYTTAADDSGDKIALKFYPQDNVTKAWGTIVACNVALQMLHEERYPNNTMTLHFDTVKNMRLVIPDKEALLKKLNTTYSELMKANYTKNYTTIMADVNSGGRRGLVTHGSTTSAMAKDDANYGGKRRLAGYTEGSVTSFARYPGTGWGWNAWQCIPMYNRESRSTVTIIKHGNTNCEAMWKQANDGCSSPAESAYEWAHTPACQRHDTCKSQ